LTLTILSPQRKLIEKLAIDELFAPGFKGQLNILPNHANFVTELETGTLRWRPAGTTTFRKASLSTGLLEIFDGQITVLAEVAELSEEIDVKRAKMAEEKSRKLLEQGGLDDENFRKNRLKLQRAVSRIATSSAEH